jgi:hypothetical protein
VSAFRSFSHISESFGLGDDSQPIFLRTSFIIVADDGTVCYGNLPIPKKEISLQQAKDCLKLVPLEDIYPLFPCDFTLAQSMSLLLTKCHARRSGSFRSVGSYFVTSSVPMQIYHYVRLKLDLFSCLSCPCLFADPCLELHCSYPPPA